jgi:Flp pilus assembly protein TadD
MSVEERLAGGGAEDSSGFELALNRAGLLLGLNRFEEAEHEYARAVLLKPSDPTAQLGLAKLRYMRGDPYFARDLVAATKGERGHRQVQLQFANVLRHTGDLGGAEVLLRDLIAREGPAPELRSSLASVLHAAGRLPEAEVQARAAVNSRPEDVQMAHNLVAVLLSLGRADEATPFIRAARARTPFDYSWIAHEATAARLTGDPAYAVLYDYERLVGVYDLEPPPGWRSMAEFNAALEASLYARHTLVRHPFDQSMRAGTQTIGNLLCRPETTARCVIRVVGLCASVATGSM